MQPRASTRLAFLLACLTAGPWASAQAPPKQPGPEANTPGEGKPLRPLPRSKNAREIRALIRSLGDAKFEVREGARDRLYQIGEEAVPYLERATEDGDAERATAAGELLEALRWKVPQKLRDVVGEGVLDDFPSLGEDERLQALQRLTQRPHEVRAVGARYLVNVVRFDPSPKVRQAGAWIYLDVSEPGLPEWDPQVLEGLADEKESDGRLNLMRSRLLQRVGKLDQAIAAAKQAFELSPKSERIVLNLTDLYIEAGRFRDALPLVAAAEKIAPQNLRLRVRVGEVLIRAGEEELGLEKLASVLQTEAAIKDLELLLALGRAYLRCHKPGEALLVYKKAQKRYPLQYQLNVAVADVMRAQGNVARAVLVYLSEIRYASPGSARFEQLRERLSEILKEGGAEWLTQEDSFFLDAQRGRQVVAVRRAVSDWLAKRGMLREAAEEARAACALSPDNASLWLALGDALRDKKDFPGASEAYRRAQKLAADSPVPAQRLRELRA
ncbi:MAG TPA: hypothetical protein DEA08_13765, partial [Planctomycetes bacterium]|nr:hypothetical protein [Planctomycetota bacterium]